MNTTFRALLLATATALALNIAPAAHAGIDTNGVATNGVASNGVATNGVGANGMASNGMGSNGLFGNGLYSNGFATNGVAPGDASLKTDRDGQRTPSAALPRVESISLRDGCEVRVR